MTEQEMRDFSHATVRAFVDVLSRADAEHAEVAHALFLLIEEATRRREAVLRIAAVSSAIGNKRTE